MGVPTFYRYIHEKFPKAVRDYIEVMPDGLDAATEADWSAEPNPNGIEVDNLYLDFNGIVHNATHPEDRPAPSGFDAMMLEVFRRVDRIVLAARPRRLLYLALDGVAPRAKMNQQRSRRFMAVREAASQLRPSALDAAADEGGGGGKFDHNAITPGTEFMLQLGKCLRYYCAERAARCPAWRRLTVILSDASVPGEGEHKIMEFIRQQRVRPGYDADTYHVVYGLDADLVMLTLATHEPQPEP
jgi:5'-3' exonuclease